MTTIIEAVERIAVRVAEKRDWNWPAEERWADLAIILHALKVRTEALRDIIKNAPGQEPEDIGYTGNADDSRDYGRSHAHWWFANIARTALEDK